MRKIWTKEKCIDDAKKYKYRVDWRKKSPSSYNIACKNNWLKECNNHMIYLGSFYKRLVYFFKFSDSHIYIGITGNFEKRVEQHLKTSRKSPVLNYIKKSGLIPEYGILTEYLPSIDAQKKEREFQLDYIKEGYIPLFDIKKAGNLGGGKIRWSKEKCIENAKKYRNRKEWQKNSSSAFSIAHKNGWIHECTRDMVYLRKPNNHWSLENCKIESIKYKTKQQWRTLHHKSYDAAKSKGWIKQCTEHMPNDIRFKNQKIRQSN